VAAEGPMRYGIHFGFDFRLTRAAECFGLAKNNALPEYPAFNTSDLVLLDNDPLFYLYEIIHHYLQLHLQRISIDQAPQWTEY
jgi:hypothetical protein